MPIPPRACVAVLAKAPLPGLVKTRLTPPFPQVEAAAMAAAALADTLEAVVATPRVQPLLVWDGPDGPWCPPGVPVVAQRSGTHAERIAAAFADGYAQFRLPVVVVGMDTPQLTADLLTAAVDGTVGAGAALGAAADGGWWALGLRRPDPALVRDVPTSTPTTGARQHARLVSAGLAVRPLPVLRDVDTAEDAAAVAAAAPRTRFARAHADAVARLAAA